VQQIRLEKGREEGISSKKRKGTHRNSVAGKSSHLGGQYILFAKKNLGKKNVGEKGGRLSLKPKRARLHDYN